MKWATILMLITVMALVFCACGKASGSIYKDAYVGTASLLPGQLFLSGTLDGKTMKIPLAKAFKDYKLTYFSFVNGEMLQ